MDVAYNKPDVRLVLQAEVAKVYNGIVGGLPPNNLYQAKLQAAAYKDLYATAVIINYPDFSITKF